MNQRQFPGNVAHQSSFPSPPEIPAGQSRNLVVSDLVTGSTIWANNSYKPNVNDYYANKYKVDTIN